MKPRVLMIAYACNPRGTGEHWLGWGWAEQAARDYELDLITTANHQQAVAERARECGIRAHFVTLPAWITKTSSWLGGAGSWWRKMAWQKRAARLAETLHGQGAFALVHQTTFHTFRVPFRASRLGIPSVWGPIAGGEHVPPGFGRFLGSAKFSEAVRNLANSVWLVWPSIRASLRRASVIFVSNHTTLHFLPANLREKCEVVPPNALRPEDERREAATRPEREEGAPLRLLYVGNCVATRAIPLVLEAMVTAGAPDSKLTVVGGGPAIAHWKHTAARLGLATRVDFTGRLAHDQLDTHYAAADALVFPALRDSGGSALLEAMSRGLPVICLDWAGPGEMVDASSGIKIPADNPRRAVREMALAFGRLKDNPAWGRDLAKAARKRAQQMFHWDEKHRLLVENYSRLIRRS